MNWKNPTPNLTAKLDTKLYYFPKSHWWLVEKDTSLMQLRFNKLPHELKILQLSRKAMKSKLKNWIGQKFENDNLCHDKKHHLNCIIVKKIIIYIYQLKMFYLLRVYCHCYKLVMSFSIVYYSIIVISDILMPGLWAGLLSIIKPVLMHICICAYICMYVCIYLVIGK